MSDHTERLQKYLASREVPQNCTELTADASTREYFRIEWPDAAAVACVYPQPFDPAQEAYLDVTGLFTSAGLPVADVFDSNASLGVVIQEDLGDRVLRDELETVSDERRLRLFDEAISMIARIQSATGLAYEMNSIASRLRFDQAKLLWELDFFKEHYFETYLQRPLDPRISSRLDSEFAELSLELEQFASVLCHRDFHTANLMIDPRGQMRIIDHQDARIGSVAYDLVSLLLDRITDLPSPEWLAEKRGFFIDIRRRLGLAKLDEAEFATEFRLQTIQRCLKAAGTFSYQSVNRGKTYFIPYIKPMLRISLRAAESLNRFHALQDVLRHEISGSP